MLSLSVLAHDLWHHWCSFQPEMSAWNLKMDVVEVPLIAHVLTCKVLPVMCPSTIQSASLIWKTQFIYTSKCCYLSHISLFKFQLQLGTLLWINYSWSHCKGKVIGYGPMKGEWEFSQSFRRVFSVIAITLCLHVIYRHKICLARPCLTNELTKRQTYSIGKDQCDTQMSKKLN